MIILKILDVFSLKKNTERVVFITFSLILPISLRITY